MEHTFMRFPNFRRNALTLSYDDGFIYDEKLIRIMDKYGLKGTFNINSGLFSEDGKRRMTKQERNVFGENKNWYSRIWQSWTRN